MIKFDEQSVSEEVPSIDLTPLIDVVFLLLIFFMVSTTFIKHNPLQIDLPKTSMQKGTGESVPLVISIDEKSQIYWRSKPITAQELETTIKNMPSLTEKQLLIEADKATPHGIVVKIFDILQRNKVTKFSIATERTSKR